MFPMLKTNEKMEFFNETERLFARPLDDNLQLRYNMSPYNQSMLGNRSSSSADSTSPESYMEMATPIQRDIFHRRPYLDSPMPAYDRPETPFNNRRHRPIVGRKIFSTEPLPINHESPLAPPRHSKVDLEPLKPWSEEVFMQGTPPMNNLIIENKNYTRNVYYELFPSENKGYEFQTPVKQKQILMANSDISPSFSISPCRSNLSFTASPNKYPGSPIQNQLASSPVPMYPKNMRHSGALANISPPFEQSLSQSLYQDGQKLCTFCKKNGEAPIVYTAHCVKERVGNRHVVTCPILRHHVCTTCGASGDNAHTRTYCPVLRSSNNGLPIPSTTITLKNTRVKSNGRRRF